MIKITVVAVGKVKERYFADGIAEYSKRLSRFCDFSIKEIEEENFQKVDDSTVEIIKEKEAQRIEKNLKGYLVVCAIEGQKLSSEKLAKLLDKLSVQGEGQITVVIGGSYGVSDRIKNKANMLLSVSDMTFPHTLFRLLLTEQIYRAFCINNGVAYHK